MSAAAAVGGAPFGAPDDRVYHAVAAGGSVEEVRRAIERSQSAAAAVNQAGRDGETPLRAACRLDRGDLVCLLLENGAEGAGDGEWNVGVRWCTRENDPARLRRLIERGVSVNTAGDGGMTPFMWACWYSRRTAGRRDLTLEILRRSSAETRRAVSSGRYSAVDSLMSTAYGHLSLQPWQSELLVGLLAAGASVLPSNATRAVPIAAAHAARREAELAACLIMAHHWRAQETFVGLSLDMGELREAEREVLEKRARLAMLELELGSGADSGSGSGSGSESEEGEATGSGGGGGED